MRGRDPSLVVAATVSTHRKNGRATPIRNKCCGLADCRGEMKRSGDNERPRFEAAMAQLSFPFKSKYVTLILSFVFEQNRVLYVLNSWMLAAALTTRGGGGGVCLVCTVYPTA